MRWRAESSNRFSAAGFAYTMRRVRSISNTAVARISSPSKANAETPPVDMRWVVTVGNIKARGVRRGSPSQSAAKSVAISEPASSGERNGNVQRLPAGGELLFQRLDILLVHADGLPQLRDTLAIFLDVRALLGQRARRAFGIRRAGLRKQLLLGRELVAQHLAADIVAAFLGSRIYFRKSGRRRRRRGLARPVVVRRGRDGRSGDVEVGIGGRLGETAIHRAADHDRLVDAAGFLRLLGYRRRGRGKRGTEDTREAGRPRVA